MIYASENFPLKKDFGKNISIKINKTKAVIRSQNDGKDGYEGSFQVKGDTSESIKEVVALVNLLLSNFMTSPDYQDFIDRENKSIDAALATIKNCQQEQDQTN